MGRSTFDYAEVVVMTCTGDSNSLEFKEPNFRASKSKANQAAGILCRVAMGGKTMADCKDTSDTEDWFQYFPDQAHITMVTVNKRNGESRKAKQHMQWVYGCEHTGNGDE